MTFLLLVGIIADENRIIVWKINCMKKLTKKHIFICIAVLLVIAAAAVYILSRTGATELTQFNSASMMDWKLGGNIDGITNVKDARSYDPEHFEYFTDDNGSGIKSLGSNTRYYLGYYPVGNVDDCRVVGFSTTEKYYSVMGIRTGDNELAAKTSLLDYGYSIKNGGYNYCSASNGKVSVYLSFEHGTVTGIAAFLK